jgi:hypothetical protein
MPRATDVCGSGPSTTSRGLRPRALIQLVLAGSVLAGCGGATPSLAPPGEAGTEAGTDAAPDAAPEAREAGAAAADGAAEVGDAAGSDGGTAVDVAVEHVPAPQPYARPAYVHLSETGLFADFAAHEITPDATAFEPTNKLWSDGATKRRWVRLPPGTQIDTSDMDHWVFPVGTKLWKEFSLGGVLLETRLIERYGLGPDDYWMGAFVWAADGGDAVLAPDGQSDINGTPHDAPAQKDCGACHRGDVGRVLGLSAIQMSRDGDPPALRDLATMGWLSDPPADLGGFPVPGDATTAAALGYLHANCGHCHNENGTAWSDTQMVLRLTVADRDAATSGVVASIVGKTLDYWRGGAITLRVDPGHPDMSALVARMSARGPKGQTPGQLSDQMPPLATEIVDPDGIAAVSQWISALPAP